MQIQYQQHKYHSIQGVKPEMSYITRGKTLLTLKIMSKHRLLINYHNPLTSYKINGSHLNTKNNPQPKLLNYPCLPKDQNTLLTRKPKKLHPRINNHTQPHINT